MYKLPGVFSNRMKTSITIVTMPLSKTVENAVLLKDGFLDLSANPGLGFDL
jgi:hypothetical protein